MIRTNSFATSGRAVPGAPLSWRPGAAALLLFPLLAACVYAEGDVTAFVDEAGHLVVLGDSASNGVLVGRTGEIDEYRVEGLFVTPIGATTVNGLDSVVLIAPGGNVRIEMGEGDDTAQVDGGQPGRVTIRGGEGNDHLALGDPVVHGDVDIDGGPGDDSVDVQDALMVRDLSIRTGAGDDVVYFFFAVIFGNTSIDTGAGADDVQAGHTWFGGTLAIDAGGGADSVVLADLIDGRIGEDLRVRLGSGDDLLSIATTRVEGSTRFDGGSGLDTYADGGGNEFAGGPPVLRRFETP